MFCSNCQSALYSGEFGQSMCRKCEVDGLKADLAQSQENYFEMVELAGKESHRAADLEDEIERLKKETETFATGREKVLESRLQDAQAEIERLKEDADFEAKIKDSLATQVNFYCLRAAAWKTSARTWRRSSIKWEKLYKTWIFEKSIDSLPTTEGKSNSIVLTKNRPARPAAKGS